MSLTERQLEVLEIVNRLKPGSVALGGGAALIAAGFVDRATRDLDFFSNNVEAIGPFADELIGGLQAHKFAVEIITRSKGFVQLEANALSGQDYPRSSKRPRFRLRSLELARR